MPVASNRSGILHTRRRTANPRHEGGYGYVQQIEIPGKAGIRDIDGFPRRACGDEMVTWV